MNSIRLAYCMPILFLWFFFFFFFKYTFSNILGIPLYLHISTKQNHAHACTLNTLRLLFNRGTTLALFWFYFRLAYMNIFFFCLFIIFCVIILKEGTINTTLLTLSLFHFSYYNLLSLTWYFGPGFIVLCCVFVLRGTRFVTSRYIFVCFVFFFFFFCFWDFCLWVQSKSLRQLLRN